MFDGLVKVCVVGMVTVESLGRGFCRQGWCRGSMIITGLWSSCINKKWEGKKGRLANLDAVFVFVQTSEQK